MTERADRFHEFVVDFNATKEGGRISTSVCVGDIVQVVDYGDNFPIRKAARVLAGYGSQHRRDAFVVELEILSDG